MKVLAPISVICSCLALAACGSEGATTSSSRSSVKPIAERPQPHVRVRAGSPPRKLIVRDLKRGSGKAIRLNTTITVHYVAVNYRSGKPTEVRWNRSSPMEIAFRPNLEIKGWEEGLMGMRVGGRRELIVPSRLAYNKGALIYIVDLLAVH